MTITAPLPLPFGVFISYARRDGEPFAAKLEGTLEPAGYRTWRDKRGINPSQDFSAEIERAIRESRYIIVCVTPDVTREDSFVRQEVAYAAYLDKPVIVLRFAEVAPPLPVFNHTWLDFFSLGWDQGIIRLLDWLRRFAPEGYVVPPPPPVLAADPLREYAGALYDAIVSYLDQTVIRLIDVTTVRTPDAVPVVPLRNLLASFKTRAGLEVTEQRVESVDAAMDQAQHRLLLLGEPGAGKTTALISYAKQRVSDRLNNPAAPLPVLLRCAEWEPDPPLSLEQWVERTTGIAADAVRDLLYRDQLLLLLDGLDELGASREETDDSGQKRSYDPRLRFLQQVLPPTGRVILSCRVQDYQDIRYQAPLNGAVTLKPLTDGQMAEYLRDLPLLWSVLGADADLRDIARTPLLLSYFAYGFKDAPQEAQQLHELSQAQFSDLIFERYTVERYAHEQRRLHDMGQVPPFSLEEIYTVLGHVAMINASGGVRRGGSHEAWGKIYDNILTRRDFEDAPVSVPSLIFIAFCIHLNLLTRVEGKLRFIHLRFRDHLVRHYCPSRLWSEGMYTSPTEPDPAQALGSLPDGEAVDLLTDLLYSDVPFWLRQSAARGLGRTGHPAALEPLVSTLTSNQDGWVRRAAAEALGQIGSSNPQALDALLSALTWDPDAWVRLIAAGAMGRLGAGDERVLDALLRALVVDQDDWVRRAAAGALGQRGAASGYGADEYRVLEVFLNTLSTDPDAWVRWTVVRSLAHISGADDTVLDALLVTRTHDPAVGVRVMATHVLGKIGGLRALRELLLALTASDDAGVRHEAASALGLSGDPDTVPALASALNDTTRTGYSGRVCDAAAAALERIGTPEALDLVRQWQAYQNGTGYAGAAQ